MRDARHLRERAEVRFEKPQLIWVTLGMLLSLGVSFALGVLVGRRAARLEPAVSPDPIAQIDEEGDLHEELTFYRRLTSPEPPGTGGYAMAPGATPSSGAARPKPAARGSGARVPENSGDAAESSSAAPVSSPTEEPGRAPPAPPAATDAEITARDALARGPARPGEYTVQVSSFQTADEARAHAAALERKGYRPFVVTADIPGRGTWYRVRLGSFADEESAKTAKTLLARADIPAWVLRAE